MTIEEIQNKLRRVEVDRARALVRRDRLRVEVEEVTKDYALLDQQFFDLCAELVEAVKNEPGRGSKK